MKREMEDRAPLREHQIPSQATLAFSIYGFIRQKSILTNSLAYRRARFARYFSTDGSNDAGIAAGAVSPALVDVDRTQRAEQAQCLEQPQYDDDDDDDIEDVFDLAVHRDVVVDQPQQHADHDQHHDNL